MSDDACHQTSDLRGGKQECTQLISAARLLGRHARVAVHIPVRPVVGRWMCAAAAAAVCGAGRQHLFSQSA